MIVLTDNFMNQLRGNKMSDLKEIEDIVRSFMTPDKKEKLISDLEGQILKWHNQKVLEARIDTHKEYKDDLLTGYALYAEEQIDELQKQLQPMIKEEWMEYKFNFESMKLKTINCSVMAGSDTTQVINEAISFAKSYDCEVRFNFNGVNMWVTKEHTLQQLLHHYEYIIKLSV